MLKKFNVLLYRELNYGLAIKKTDSINHFDKFSFVLGLRNGLHIDLISAAANRLPVVRFCDFYNKDIPIQFQEVHGRNPAFLSHANPRGAQLILTMYCFSQQKIGIFLESQQNASVHYSPTVSGISMHR